MKKPILLLLITYFPIIALATFGYSLLIASHPVSAQELKILPEKDTFVDSTSSDKNFGKNNKFSVGFTHSSKIAFLKFNLDNIAKDSPPEKAMLKLELNQSLGDLKPIEVEIFLPSRDWHEEEINWNNKPSLYKTELTISLEATPGAQKIDITPLVHQWLDGSIKNYGLALFQRGENFERTFFSKENEKTPPTLTLVNNQKNPPVGGTTPNNQQSTINNQQLEIFSIEEKEATETAEKAASRQPPAASSQPLNNNKKELETGDWKLAANLINSKNIIILGLGLLALLTVGGEKILKVLKKEKS